MKNKEKIILCVEVAIFAAIGFVLDLLASLYSGYLFPFGGSLSLALIPIVVLSFRRGPLAGFLCGLLVGALDLIDGVPPFTDTWYNYFLMIMLDYLLAYPLAGLCGLFKPLIKKMDFKLVVTIASFFGGMAKFIVHFLSGVILWPEFPGQPILERCIYSLSYNGSYMIPTIIVCTCLMFLLSFKFKNLFNIED